MSLLNFLFLSLLLNGPMILVPIGLFCLFNKLTEFSLNLIVKPFLIINFFLF